MPLRRIDISGVRNLESVRLDELAPVNIVFGSNGSGKTSLLESIFLLATGRSFRTPQIKSVINFNADSCTVYGELAQYDSVGSNLSLGVSRDRAGAVDVKIGGERAQSRAELVASLPVLLIDSASFDIVAGSPVYRRQFVDWGVFHVEHLFLGQWQRFQRAIKQRNMLLRRGKIPAQELLPWDRELAATGTAIDVSRGRYIDYLAPIFSELMQQLSPVLGGVELRYRRGWDRALDLEDALQQSYEVDSQQGYTHVGPQRADMRIVFNGKPASESLSRGQQKLVVCALKLAQGRVMVDHQKSACVYLIDDLPSELDAEHCAHVSSLLGLLEAQVFVSCIGKQDVSVIWPTSSADNSAVFHVEHGHVERVPHGPLPK